MYGHGRPEGICPPLDFNISNDVLTFKRIQFILSIGV